jgi:RNase P/RNase MRP subunit p29
MKRTLLIAGLVVLALGLVTVGVVWATDTAPSPQQSAQQAGTAPDQNTADKSPRLPDAVVRGTVTIVTGDEVLVKTDQDLSVTLLLTETTALWVPGEPPTLTVKLAVGDPILAFGRPAETEAGDKTLLARIIVVASDKDLPKVLIRGQVLCVTQQTIVVDTGRRERAITIMPRTRFWSPGGQVKAQRDVRVGDPVIALGQPNELGQWIAGAVGVLARGTGQPGRQALTGEVKAIDPAAGTLTIQVGQRGEVTIVTGDDTRYRIPGIDDPALDNIKIGDRITAIGRFEADSTTRFLAQGINIAKPK